VPTTEILVDDIDSALGVVVIAASDGRLIGLDFGEHRRRMIRTLTTRAGRAAVRRARDPFGLSARIRNYLDGDLTAIDGVPVDPGGTRFQRQVWTALRRIPAGTTVTYAEMACAVGRPRAARAVGTANARNPIPIVIPCHRMIGGDGSLTGYGGGLSRKRWLLAHEGALPSHQGTAGVRRARRGSRKA